MSAACVRRAMRVVVVPALRAEAVRRQLHRRGLVDRALRITKRGDEVLIPVCAVPPDGLLVDGARLADLEGPASRPRPRNPRETLRRKFRQYRVPPDVAPSKWERLGDVIVLRLSGAAEEHAAAIGFAFAETFDVRAVVEDRSGVHGVLRTPEVRILWGRGLEVEHPEGGGR